MKRYGKIIGIILLCLLVIWITLIVIDCIRLSDIIHNGNQKKPLITIYTREYEDETGTGTEYIGLGYSVNYYKPNTSLGYKVEVNLFYIITVGGFELL